MSYEIEHFVNRNGGPANADAVGRLLDRWQLAALQVQAWRLKQTQQFGPNWLAVDEWDNDESALGSVN